jgi:uncharacterized protein
MIDADRALLDATVASLRAAGARFAFVHGSRLGTDHGPDADLDVAAWWPEPGGPAPWDVPVPAGVDLLVLHGFGPGYGVPLTLLGRIALHGEMLFDDDPPSRVRWQATLRKIYLDELPRIEQSRSTFFEVTRGRP